jgi:hypothetical protein
MMEVSGQLHAWATLSLWKQPPVITRYELGNNFNLVIQLLAQHKVLQNTCMMLVKTTSMQQSSELNTAESFLKS